MSLFDIKDKLYRKDMPENISEHDISQYDPAASETGEGFKRKEDDWVKEENPIGQTEKRTIKKGILALIGILCVILALALVFAARQLMFNDKNIQLSVVGPSQISSGKIGSYEIDYKNNNWIGLSNVTVMVTYPENFKPEAGQNFTSTSRTSGTFTISSIGPRGSGKLFLKGRAYSPKGALIYIKSVLSYRPFSFGGAYSADAQLGISVQPAAIILEVQGQQNVVSGNAVDYTIEYRNNTSEEMNDLEMRVTYPEGFTFSSSDTKPSSIDGSVYVWKITSLKPGEAGRLLISGRLEGVNGTVKKLQVSIGTSNQGEFMSYNDGSVDTNMASSPLIVSQTVNDNRNVPNVSPGESLRFSLIFKNTGSVGLRNVILTEKIDSPVLDYATLDRQGGDFDSSTNMITWKAADIPAFNNLSPGQVGEVNFTILVKDKIPLDGPIKKNFVVVSVAKIDSPDISTPIASNKVVYSNEIDMKLNSKIILETQGFYNDATIPNSGPIPPRVGQETTYTLHWRIRNVSNDINNATVSAYLPTNATFTGKFSPGDARLSYNERTNQLVWNIGKVDAGTGILNAAPEVAFQVRIKPSIDQVNRQVGILGKATFTAEDLFTGEKPEVSTDPKNTSLPEDPSIMRSGGDKVTN